MGKHLTDKDISNVVELLDDWPVDSKLTWELLVEAFRQDYGVITTRQTLEKQTRVKSAFAEVKALISGGTIKVKTKLPPSLKIASERLEKQQRKIDRLESENQQLLEQFQVWLYNAYRHNITIEQLSTPLPQKDN